MASINPIQTTEKNDQFIILGDKNFIATFCKQPESVEIIYDNLLAQGCPKEDITLLMSEETRNAHFPHNARASASVTDLGNTSLESGGIGAAIGGTIGGAAAAIAALGTSLAIPGLGIIVSGALAASLAGMGAGAAAGGLVGALAGLGIPDEQAKVVEKDLKGGGVLICVKADSEQERKKWQNLLHQQNFLNEPLIKDSVQEASARY